MKNLIKKIVVSLLMVMILMVNMPTSTYASETKVELQTADSFAILAGSTITNTGTTMIRGDLGLHPGTAFDGSETATVRGEIHLTDAVALQAKTDLLAAYNDAAGRSINTFASELGGSTLTPGVYTSATSFQVTGTLVLDGQNDPNAVFILQAGSTLTTASNSKIELINGAHADNIYWQVGTSATLGTYSEFAGNILASESITATTGAIIQGKLLALGGAVTLDSNTIVADTTSTLTVVKTVTGDSGSMTLPVFEITVTGPVGFSETRTFVHGESYTWEYLVPGDYNVVESRIGLGSRWTVSGEGPVSLVANETSLVTITNAYNRSEDRTREEDTPVGSLMVEKTVVGDTGDRTFSPFRFTVTGPDEYTATRTLYHGESYTWDDLVPGDYTVTESRAGLGSEWTVSGEGTVAVEADETTSVSITNLFTPVAEILPIEIPLDGSVPIEKITDGSVPIETITEESVPTDIISQNELALVEIEETGEAIPQTGQETDYGMAIFFGSLAVIVAGVGLYLGYQKKRLNE